MKIMDSQASSLRPPSLSSIRRATEGSGYGRVKKLGRRLRSRRTDGIHRRGAEDAEAREGRMLVTDVGAGIEITET